MTTKKKTFHYTPEQKRWLKALRSGEYKQTTGALGRVKKGRMTNCCLGVACEVFKEKVGIPVLMDEDAGCKYYDGDEATLPDKMVKLLNLRSSCGSFNDSIQIGNKHCDSLVYLNDDTSYGFKQIAAFIEKHPTEIFTNEDEAFEE